MRTVLTSLLALLVLALAAEGGEPTAEGYWTGVIDLPGQQLEIKIDIAREGEAWTAAFYAPLQGIWDATMTGVEIEGRSVSFRIPRTQGEPTFRGELSQDGETISGGFTQSGQTMDFRLARSEKPKELEIDIYARYREPGVPGEGLDGTWRAVLMSGPSRIRLSLRVWTSEEGELEGSLDSIDQGVMGTPVSSFVVQGDSVWFPMVSIGAEYQGTMRKDGSEIIGLWRQTGQEFPVTFRREAR